MLASQEIFKDHRCRCHDASDWDNLRECPTLNRSPTNAMENELFGPAQIFTTSRLHDVGKTLQVRWREGGRHSIQTPTYTNRKHNILTLDDEDWDFSTPWKLEVGSWMGTFVGMLSRFSGVGAETVNSEN